MTATKIKAGLISAAILAGIGVPAWQQTRLERAKSENEQLRAQVREVPELRQKVERLRKVQTDQTELDDLRKWQARTEPELARLRGMAGVARRANAEVAELRAQLARKADENGAKLGPSPMGEMMKTAMDQQVETRLSRMTASLHLTPEQVQTAREILLRQARVTTAGIQQAFAGKFDTDQIHKLGKEAGNPEAQLRALLTPEQQAGYAAYKQEEAQENASLAANNELLQMQSTLGLTAEQQDRAFAALYGVNVSQMNGTAVPAFTSPSDQMQWASDQKIKALQPVLTESQMAAYRQLQHNQLKYIKDMVSKMQPGHQP